MKPKTPSARARPDIVTFAPAAWLKLLFFCHAGPTEVGGFGISAKDNPLYVEDMIVKQQATAVTVCFEDQAVAEFFDRLVDQGLKPCRFARLWMHTHPGESPLPSVTDEETFARSFGACDWAVMFIVSRAAKTYARLSFSAGPGGQVVVPVAVDWSDWPRTLGNGPSLEGQVEHWRSEYAVNVHRLPDPLSSGVSPCAEQWWDTAPWSPALDDECYEPTHSGEIHDFPF